VPTDDGAELHVECAGDPDAPVTVVFAHGWALSRLSWADQFEALRAEARVVRYDQRHHGLSTGAPDASGPDGAGAPDGGGGITIDRLGRDLAVVVEAVVPRGRWCWRGTRWVG
jgi:pimeloyl-ACP methyl ester carboxylesterase